MSKVNLNVLVVVCALIMALAGQGADGATIYVPGDYATIQEAIEGADDYDQIEVAPGTYPEAINFMGLAIRLYSSGGPDVTTINGGGVALHVVLCRLGEGADTILEGFTITGGNASGSDYSGQGGGMLNRDGSSPTVTDCIFSNNDANTGGGMCNTDGSNPTVTDCTFTGNSATTDGGGLYNDNSNPQITNCSFVNNTAEDNGGGMYNNNSSSPAVTNCTFSTNTANTTSGGGMYNNGSSPTVTNCTFTGNTAQDYGGGMYNLGSLPTVINCLFHQNTASTSKGGGIANYTGSHSTITNCTFYLNAAPSDIGGGIRNYESSPNVANCILWANVPDQISSQASSLVVSYSDVQGGHTGTGNIDADPLFLDAAGGDFRLISSGSPCVDAGNNGVVTEPNDLAGNPRIVDGNWDSSAIVDMGAYELQSKQIHNITQDSWYERIQTAIDDAEDADQIEVGPGTYNEAIDFLGKAIRLYSSSGPAVTTIDANGIAGAYHVVQCVNGEDANTILDGFTITGGNATGSSFPEWDGGGMYNNVSSPTVTNCIFTGNLADHGGGMYNYNSAPAVNDCTFSDNSANNVGGGMDNYTGSDPIVTNCTFSDNTAGTNGGGIYNYESSPSVTNCTFSDNTATGGGGMHNSDNSNPTVTNCKFYENEAITSGGGMFNNVSWPTVAGCDFYGNQAINNDGGGMCNLGSSPGVVNCKFSGNSATGNGGGMYDYVNCSPTISNCAFMNNSAQWGGGLYNYDHSNPTVTNCTFSENTATSSGAGIMNNLSSTPTLTNCILWGNSPDQIHDYDSYSWAVASYSDVQDGYPGTGNIDIDPNFVDANNPDPNLVNLRLLPDSPCIDAADSTAVPSGLFVDLDGNPRGVDDPQTPNTGVSILGITVDMGAYELDPCHIPGDNNCDGMVNLKDLAILCNNWLVGAE